MKILLDENLPVKLKADLKDHQAFTVREMNWHGKKNGELLGMATLNDFQAFLTMDKQLIYQQNLKKFNILIVILKAPDNKIRTLRPYIEKTVQALPTAPEAGFIHIELL